MTAKQLSALTGVSLRQLQWWDEQGIVSPRIIRHRRTYCPAEIRTVQIIKRFLDHGMSQNATRKIARKAREIAEWYGNGSELWIASFADKTGGLQFDEDPASLCDRLATIKAPCTIVRFLEGELISDPISTQGQSAA